MQAAVDLGAALLDMASAASRVVNVAIGQPPPSTSTAASHLAQAPDGPDWSTNSARRAHEHVLTADLAAIDHLRALAVLLRSPVSTSVSAATVTRGAIEAFSRVHWLLSSSSSDDLVQRHVSLALDDIYFAGKLQPDSPLKTGRGASLPVGTYEQRLRSRLDQYLGHKPLKVRQTALAAAVLDDAVQDGRVKYSQLSGAAHGQSTTVNAFVDLESSQTSPTREMAMHLPLAFAIEFVAYGLVVCARQHNAIAAYFAVPLAEDERWQQIRNRSLQRFRAIDLAQRSNREE